MNSRRSYTMTARAEAVEATRSAILDAAVELSQERLIAQIGLDDIAARAGVSVQTLLRHFGTRAGLIDAAAHQGASPVVEERRAPVGDVTEAVRILLDHYEKRGSSVLLLLAQEQSEEQVARITSNGKALHRTWVAEVFQPFLPAGRGAREELLDLLVVATDVYAWKLLRLDRGRQSRCPASAKPRQPHPQPRSPIPQPKRH
jgi:AcrR family transcriptional regulator